MLSRLTDYLSGRTQFFVVNGQQSNIARAFDVAFHKGQYWAPLCYTNDLPNSVFSSFVFISRSADDTTVYCVGETEDNTMKSLKTASSD